jgi:hypothetical protein
VAGSAAFFVISGSAFRTRTVRKIRVSGIHLTTLAVLTIVAEKWSTTAFTGGTETALTRTPLDAAYPAAQTDGLVLVYTGAPTEGTLVGTVGTRRVVAKSTTVVDGAEFPVVEFDFTDPAFDLPTQPSGVPLHGVLQSLSLAFGGDPASAVTMSLEVEWAEGAGP